MSNPTFNSVTLCSSAAADAPASPKPRLYIETLPGVDGEYVQAHGHAGRQIQVRGVLACQAASAALAQQGLKVLLRARQELADGATMSTYVGVDGASYANCVLLSYQASGGVSVSPSRGSFRAVVRIEAVLRQLTP